MIDATPPVTPNYDDDLENRKDLSGGTVEVEPTVPSVTWYQFWHKLQIFCAAMRNAPKQVEQADLTDLLVRLIQGRFQSGIQVWVLAPFNHMMRFDGTKWTFAPGDGGGGYRVTFASPPSGDGWHLCDGTANVTFLKADGTLGTETLPNTAGLYFRR